MWQDQEYRTNYWVFVAPELDSVLELRKLATTEDKWWDSQAAAFTEDQINEKGINVIICFQGDAEPGIVVHEAVHAANCTFKHHGVKLDVNNDEHQAYYTEYLVNQIVKAFALYHTKLYAKITKTAKERHN